MAKITSFLRQNSIALLALFIALGGTSYAAVKLPRNSVGSAQIKAGAVNSSEIRNGAVRNVDLGRGAVTGSKIRRNSVTSLQVKPGSLLLSDIKAGQLPKAPSSLPPNGAAGGALTGTYPNPALADGVVTASKLGRLPSARVIRTTTQSIPNLTTTVVQFESEQHDNGGLFDPADNDALTIPITGTYVITAGARWAANADGGRTLNLHGPQPGGIRTSSGIPANDGTTLPFGGGAAVPDTTRQSVSTTDRFLAGQQVFASVSQDSGTPLNLVPSQSQVHLSATYVGP